MGHACVCSSGPLGVAFAPLLRCSRLQRLAWMDFDHARCVRLTARVTICTMHCVTAPSTTDTHATSRSSLSLVTHPMSAGQSAPHVNTSADAVLMPIGTFWPYIANVTLAAEMAEKWGFALKVHAPTCTLTQPNQHAPLELRDSHQTSSVSQLV